MKKYLKSFITRINTFFIKNSKVISYFKGSSAYFFKVVCSPNNILNFQNTKIEKSEVILNGVNNLIESKGSLILNSIINIQGQNNELIIGPDVKLRAATIHIRGDKCKISIGEGTSTGGVRIVNVGNDNNIIIGENCLFADHIEIWASDTHSIYDENNEMINPEKSITIGDRVWVGGHVIILKGITIGSDSVIGMGTMVTKDIPDKVISAGTPNRTLKKNITWKLDY